MTNTNDPGEAAVPAGYRLGDGWELALNQFSCTGCDATARYDEFGGRSACGDCAVEMGALVPIDPHVAEPPGFRPQIPVCHPKCGTKECPAKHGGKCVTPCGPKGQHWCTALCRGLGRPLNPPIPAAPVAEPAQPVCKAVANDGTRCELPEGHPDSRFHVAGEYCWTSGCPECQKDLSGPCARCAGRPLNPPPVPPGPVPPEGEPGDLRFNPFSNRASRRALAVADAPAAAPAKAPLSTRLRASVRSNRMDARGEIERHADELEAMEAQLAIAIRERDEQRGRAERAERALQEQTARADKAEARERRAEERAGKWYVAAMNAGHAHPVASKYDRRMEIAQREADARVAEAYRTGWRKGAEATRAAVYVEADEIAEECNAIARKPGPMADGGDGIGSQWQAQNKYAARIAHRIAGLAKRLSLPPCPEGPPAGTATIKESLMVGDAEAAAVASGEAGTCEAVATDGTRCELPIGHAPANWHVRGHYCWTSLGMLDTPEAVTAAVEKAWPPPRPWPRGSLAEEVGRVGHAFRDKGRKDDIRALADKVAAIESTQADAIKAAVDKANNRAADAWLLRWKGKEPFASMTREDFEAWLRSGADAPGAGKP